ncbi:MAG: V-type ATP synthase subunit E [Firmicutes bacterium]|jgi:V/A-type H+-transporting ATPase subunit E|nr:V-type ATP synthase subunit E [Bacillota bacterium]MDD4336982.1 V-type ATP synthase subunit E [Bacillota bacterium]MDD4792346.1 V-type ATP synthase subunit E [Bacillota bacterium]
MENLERLKSRILDEARERADRILSAADERCAEIEQEAKAKSDETRKSAIERARAVAGEEERRAEIMRSLEIRNAVLRAKGDAVEELMAEVPARIRALPDEEYLGIMKKMLISGAPAGEVEVVVAALDRGRINSEFIKDAASELDAGGKKTQLRLSSDTVDLAGGFILRASTVEVDCSLDSLLVACENELAPLIAEALFGRS